MKWYSKLAISALITLAGAALVYAGVVMLSPNGGRYNGLGIFALMIGLFIAFFGLAFLLYKPSSGYDMPLPDQRAPPGPANEEANARLQRERALNIGMSSPIMNEYFRSPPGDGLPVQSLREKWK